MHRRQAARRWPKLRLIALGWAVTLLLAACGPRFDETSTGDTVAPSAPSPPVEPDGSSTDATATTTAAPELPEVPEGPGPAPGVADDEIKIGYLLPISGAAPIPTSFDKGVNAYWDYVNEQGGIDGRSVSVIVEDTESQAEVGKDKAKKLVEDDEVFTVVVLDRLENQAAINGYLDDRSVPNIAIQAPADLPADQIWTFGVTIDHRVQGDLVAQYFVNELGLSEVGIAYENTPALEPGRDAFVEGVEALGAEVVFSDAIDADASDFLDEALELSESDAEAVWLYMAPLPAAKIANQSLDAGFHPIWFANSISWAFDLTFAVAPEALAGARAFSPWVALSDPRAATYQEQYRRLNDGEEPDDIGLIGWGVGQIVAEALRRAGPELGQNSLRDALQHLDYSPDIWAPLSFDDGVRQGANRVAVLAERDGRWVTDIEFGDSFSP